MFMAKPNCLLFPKQTVLRAFAFAFAKAGKSIAAKMAIMAMTTNSSIKVNPLLWEVLVVILSLFIICILTFFG